MKQSVRKIKKLPGICHNNYMNIFIPVTIAAPKWLTNLILQLALQLVQYRCVKNLYLQTKVILTFHGIKTGTKRAMKHGTNKLMIFVDISSHFVVEKHCLLNLYLVPRISSKYREFNFYFTILEKDLKQNEDFSS